LSAPFGGVGGAALIWIAKTKKLPAKIARPYIRGRGHLIGSFAWERPPLDAICWP
jgi:hypothetical protein